MEISIAMKSDLINSINNLSNNINILQDTLRTNLYVQWWNTQWFSAVIGALTGFVGTFIYSSWKNRNKKLFDFYQWLLKQAVFSTPEGLLSTAISTSYGQEDKEIPEKMVIELRSHIKYWYEPLSKIHFLFLDYENSLKKIKNGSKNEIIEQKEFKDAKNKFQKIMDFVHKKTGENEWTS